MSFVIAALFFVLPFAAFALWRRRNPVGEPSVALLTTLAAVVLAAVATFAWYGLSRREDPGRYVAPHLEDGRVVPGHTEPRR